MRGNCEVSTFIALAAGMALTLSCACSANAVFVQDFCGSTSSEGILDHGIDGTISFAVIDISQASTETKGLLEGAFAPGAGSDTEFDAEAKYAYLYQIVNDGPNETVIDFVTVSLDGIAREDITSWGHFEDVSLTNAQGQVGTGAATAGNRLNPFARTTDPFAVGAPANIGVDSPGLIGTATDSASPSAISITDAGNGSVVFHSVYMPFTPGQNPLYNHPADGHRSNVIGFTSDLPPGLDRVAFQDGGGQALGTVASATKVNAIPEPSSMVLLGTAGLGLLLAMRRKVGARA